MAEIKAMVGDARRWRSAKNSLGNRWLTVARSMDVFRTSPAQNLDGKLQTAAARCTIPAHLLTPPETTKENTSHSGRRMNDMATPTQYGLLSSAVYPDWSPRPAFRVQSGELGTVHIPQRFR